MKTYIFLIIIFLNIFELPISAQTADNFLLKAGMLSNQKEFTGAFEAINQSTSKDNKQYSRIMADIQYGLKNHREASSIYSELEKESPGSYQLQLARCAGLEGNMTKAMEHLNVYFTQKNKLPISKIINDEAFKKFKGNATWENMWQKIDYSETELKVNQVNAAAENGDTQYLSGLLDEALRKYSTNSELLYQQSRFFSDRKMYSAAEKSINQALSYKSTDDRYHYLKAQVLQKNGKTKEALNSINDAIKRDPYNAKYYLSRIELNKALGNSEEVNKDLKLINFCLPDNSEVQLTQIKIDADKGNYINAIDGLNNLIQKDQTNKDYYLLRGKLSLKTQKLQNADEDFGMALDLNPEDAEANLGKGIAKYKLQDNSAACYYWQKAANQGNNEAMGYLNKFCGK